MKKNIFALSTEEAHRRVYRRLPSEEAIARAEKLWVIQRWFLFLLPPEISHRVAIWGLKLSGLSLRVRLGLFRLLGG